MSSFNNSKWIFAIAALGVASCAEQGPQTRVSGAKQAASGEPAPGNGDASQSGAATPATPGTAPVSSVPVAAASCADQWKAHQAYFATGLQLVYTTNVKTGGLLPQSVPGNRTEQILASSDAQISRKISVTADNDYGKQLLSQVKIPEQVIETKEVFLKVCEASGGKAQPSIPVSTGELKVLLSREESIAIGSTTVQSQYSKIQTSVLMGSTPATAVVEVWSSLKIPGLALKEVVNLTGVPIVGTGTITDELKTPAAQ